MCARTLTHDADIHTYIPMMYVVVVTGDGAIPWPSRDDHRQPSAAPIACVLDSPFSPTLHHCRSHVSSVVFFEYPRQYSGAANVIRPALGVSVTVNDRPTSNDRSYSSFAALISSGKVKRLMDVAECVRNTLGGWPCESVSELCKYWTFFVPLYNRQEEFPD